MCYSQFKIIDFLLEKGFDINTRNSTTDTFPLILACSFQQSRCVKYLVEKGANVNLVDSNKASALGMSALVNDVETAEYLLV